jgi:signal transduction histidine kinase
MTTAIQLDFRVLVIAPFGKDAALIEKVLKQSGIDTCGVTSLEDLADCIPERSGAAVIAEEALHDEVIAVLAQRLSTQPAWSDFPLIVLTRGGKSTALTEKDVRSRAPLGNVTLLERPLRPATLISSVRSALNARQRQYEIRNHLQRRKQAEEELQRAHDVLETLVEQRTTALRVLSTRLIRVQDDERRRVARELHDGLGQYLVAAKMSMDVLSRRLQNVAQFEDAQQLVERAISETRTLSHLLHPPLLDEAGFASAALWFVEGFGSRSGIRASLDLPPNLPRLAPEIETALFRILQEALTNVHRHSHSAAVEVRLTVEESEVTLTVKDFGTGMPRETLDRFTESGTNVGVGLSGIRERIKELNGAFDLQSTSKGTTLSVTIPRRLPDNRPENRLDGDGLSPAEFSRFY